MGVLHHGAHNGGALVATDEALPQQSARAIAGVKKALAAAVRALPAMGPAGSGKSALALLLAAAQGLKLGQ